MTGWSLVYEGFDPAQEKLREALCTLGNGYFATRGAAPESSADAIHYPGTYVAGCYNRLPSQIEGRTLEHEDLVNAPNWLPLTFRIEEGAWFDLARVEILGYRQELDLRHGVLVRHVRFRDGKGRTTRLETRRLVHMTAPHLAALETVLTPEDWSGRIDILTALDGRVVNGLVEQYQALSHRHLEPVDGVVVEPDSLVLTVQTSQSRIRIAEAARTRFRVDGQPIEAERRTTSAAGYIAQEVAVHARAGVAVATATVVRLQVFHLLQTTSPHTTDLDASAPARGLHGEAYRGHIFWDELFVFPFLNLRKADITRGLLHYRYRRLDAARAAARAAGYRGAMFPWQSGSDGREETPAAFFNPRSGRWMEDDTRLQRHVGSAIAYNVWQYYQVTGDLKFLVDHGAEMIVEIARFWASIAVYDRALGRYRIRGVIGPDEYHPSYPSADRPGIDDNAYTNLMAVWVLCRAADVLALLPADERSRLCERLAVSSAEVAEWERISRRMRLVFHSDGILSQFDGYEALDEFDWAGYKARYGNLYRLDFILEAEGDSTTRYKLSKQADVLMLFYLFSAEELAELFERLEYRFEPAMIPRTVDYYFRRSAHDSTVGRVAESWVLARGNRPGSWEGFLEALMSDVGDIQGGTTPEGIHLGAMAGSVDILQRCYTGLELRGDVLWLNPRLPRPVRRLHLFVHYRGHSLDVEVHPKHVRVSAERCAAPSMKVGVRDRVYELRGAEVKEFPLAP